MLRAVVLAVFFFLLACGAAVGYFNTDVVRFNYLIDTVQMPLIYLLLLELALVMIIALAAFAGRVWALKLEIRGLRKRLAATEVELKNLRSLTGTPSA